jgi:hypothetical protein
MKRRRGRQVTIAKRTLPPAAAQKTTSIPRNCSKCRRAQRAPARSPYPPTLRRRVLIPLPLPPAVAAFLRQIAPPSASAKIRTKTLRRRAVSPRFMSILVCICRRRPPVAVEAMAMVLRSVLCQFSLIRTLRSCGKSFIIPMGTTRASSGKKGTSVCYWVLLTVFHLFVNIAFYCKLKYLMCKVKTSVRYIYIIF